jgi:hypothetical protein
MTQGVQLPTKEELEKSEINAQKRQQEERGKWRKDKIIKNFPPNDIEGIIIGI